MLGRSGPDIPLREHRRAVGHLPGNLSCCVHARKAFIRINASEEGGMGNYGKHCPRAPGRAPRPASRGGNHDASGTAPTRAA